MTVTVSTLQVQINTGGYGCPQVVPIAAINNGNTSWTWGSTPFINGAPVSASNPLFFQASAAAVAYTATSSASVTTASTPLLAAGSFTQAFQLQTQPGQTGNVYLNISGGAAVVGQGIVIPAGGGSQNFGPGNLPIPTGAIAAISDSGTVNVLIAGA